MFARKGHVRKKKRAWGIPHAHNPFVLCPKKKKKAANLQALEISPPFSHRWKRKSNSKQVFLPGSVPEICRHPQHHSYIGSDVINAALFVVLNSDNFFAWPVLLRQMCSKHFGNVNKNVYLRCLRKLYAALKCSFAHNFMANFLFKKKRKKTDARTYWLINFFNNNFNPKNCNRFQMVIFSFPALVAAYWQKLQNACYTCYVLASVFLSRKLCPSFDTVSAWLKHLPHFQLFFLVSRGCCHFYTRF